MYWSLWKKTTLCTKQRNHKYSKNYWYFIHILISRKIILLAFWSIIQVLASVKLCLCFWFWDHTQWCLRLTPRSSLRFFPDGVGKPYQALGSNTDQLCACCRTAPTNQKLQLTLFFLFFLLNKRQKFVHDWFIFRICLNLPIS